jgi:hypothetical protein
MRDSHGDRWDDPAAVLLDVPLGEIASRNRGAITVLNGGAENPLRFKHALGVMAQRSVAKIAESLFRRSSQSCSAR